jgi:hypothetical protein
MAKEPKEPTRLSQELKENVKGGAIVGATAGATSIGPSPVHMLLGAGVMAGVGAAMGVGKTIMDAAKARKQEKEAAIDAEYKRVTGGDRQATLRMLRGQQFNKRSK